MGEGGQEVTLTKRIAPSIPDGTDDGYRNSAAGARWARAQDYEREWWERRAAGMDLGYYRGYAGSLLNAIAPFMTLDASSRILEIGSGAAGIITFLPGARRVAVDPLEEFYASVDAFATFRDPAVIYHAAMGERLPFDAAEFDFVIMDNVLDHCADPARVLQEVARVLAPDGVVYFRQNVYHQFGRMVRSAMELFTVDKGHLHTFTRRGMVRALQTAGFAPTQVQRAGFAATWWRELTAGTAKELAKAFLFATRDKTLWICRKT